MKGLVHRDIKPANIYVCRMGLEYDFVKVLDFGLVKLEHAGSRGSGRASAVMGTPAYMAPEVILGEAADRRVDVYGLGCVAYYLLTGERVFDSLTPMRTMVKHVQETPRPPSSRAPHPVPAAVDALVLACLAKDPEQRPRDGEAVYEMVRACASREWDGRSAREWWEEYLPDLARAPMPRPFQAAAC